MLAVLLSTGATDEETVTVKLLVPVWAEASVPMQVTVVVPILNVEPEAGEQTTLIGVAQPVAVGAVKLTAAEQPEARFVVMLEWLATLGAAAAMVTVATALVEKPEPSVTVKVTFVTPTGNGPV